MTENLRIVSWNVDGVGPYLGSAAKVPLVAVHESFGDPDVLCLQETRVRPRDVETVRALTDAIPGFTCHAAFADDPANASFRGGRVYGVATYVRNGLRAERASLVEPDREGRIAAVILARLGVAVVNVYAVNGTAKPYFDHELGRIEGDRHAFKRRVQDHVIAAGRSLALRDFALILAGDWNVSRTALDTYPRLRIEEPHAGARRHLNEMLIPALDVVDVFRELYPDERAYTWYNRRARRGALDAARVDYALVSRALLSSTSRATIDGRLESRFGSDHAPLDVELSLPVRGANACDVPRTRCIG